MLRTFLLAALLTLGLAATAQARTGNDPCSGDQHHTEKAGHDKTRLCFAKFEIPPHRTWHDPTSDADAQCPKPLGMRTSETWDYWTHNNEWVTWNWSATRFFRDGEHVGLRPWYHNWGSWNWGVRTHINCSIVGPVLRAFTVADPDEDPVGPDDAVLLGSGDDLDRGTSGDDEEVGGKGDDTLSGGQGDDELLGGKGKDHLSGGPGEDELFDDQGEDVIDGGPGNDRVSTKDGNHDVVDCGPGEDIAVGDPHDTFTHCEHVYTTPANTPAEPPAI